MLTIEDIYEIHEKYHDALQVKVEEFTIGDKKNLILILTQQF